MSEPDCSQQAYAEAKHEYETRREGEVSDIVERARLVQRVNAHWSDSICECEECTEERFDLITPMADYIDALTARLAAAERERDKALVKADTLQFLVNQRDIDIHALRAQLAAAMERTP